MKTSGIESVKLLPRPTLIGLRTIRDIPSPLLIDEIRLNNILVPRWILGLQQAKANSRHG